MKDVCDPAVTTVMPALAGLLSRFTSALVLRALLFVAIFSLAAVPPLDPDLWWHLANGRLITTTASIPHVDLYSFSAAGQPWVMHEWLADLGMYGLYQFGGLPLLVAIAALVVTAAALCLFTLLRGAGLHPTAAVGLTLVGALAGSTAWGARPQLLNLLFTGILLVGLTRYREHHLRAWLLPPFIWLWANLHSGFLVGVIIGLLFVAGEALDARLGRGTPMAWSRIRALALAVGAAAVLAIVNPFGIQTVLFPLGTLTSPLIQNNIQEWASPDFHSTAGLMLEVVLFLMLAGLATRRVSARSSEWLLAFALLYLGLASQRNVPLFILGAAPLAGRCAQALLQVATEIVPRSSRSMTQAALRWTPPRPAAPGPALGALNLALLVVVTAGMLEYRANPNLQPVSEAAAIQAVLPVEATDALERIGRPLRIFNYYDYGGYLVWRLYPGGSRVFIDGRVEVYGSRVFSEYLQVSYLAEGWPAVIARANPDAILMPTAHPAVGLLEHDPNWRLLSRDPVATVFTRVGFPP